MADLKLMTGQGMSQYTDKLKVKLRWSGTKAEYDAIAVKDAYTSYYITDQKKLIRNGIEYGEPTNFLSDVAVDGDKLTITKMNGGVSSTKDFDMSGKATTSALNGHINDTTNPHGVTKAQLELGNVDNTSDEAKPVSTAQQNALDGKVDKQTDHSLSKITLNGTVTSEPTFFAPTVAGTSGDVVAWMDDGKIGYKKLASAMVFKGSKTGQEISELTGLSVGDTYYCTEDYTAVTPPYNKGFVYTYCATGFSNVGTVADMSKYLKKDEYAGQGVIANTLLVVNSTGQIAPATKTLDALQNEINNKSTIQWDQLQTSGNMIAKVNLNGTSFQVYSPVPSVDSSLSSSSTNPVQNKVLKVEIDNLKNNKQDAVPAQGSVNQPVYASSIGRFSTCNQYAGGTALTIDGTSYSAKSTALTLAKQLWSNDNPTQGQEYSLSESSDNYAFCVVQIKQGSGHKCAILRVKGSNTSQHFEINSSTYTQYTINGNKLKITLRNNAYPCEIWGLLKKG